MRFGSPGCEYVSHIRQQTASVKMRNFDSTVTEKPNWSRFIQNFGAGRRWGGNPRHYFYPLFLIEDQDSLFGLPLLIREFARGCVEKLVVVGSGLLLLVQRVVGGRP